MIKNSSIAKLHQALVQKEISSIELTRWHLDAIQAKQKLNAFISIDEDYALKQAKAADFTIHQGSIQPLTGIPFAHKDIFCTEKLPTTCGSKMLASYQSPFSATIVENLAKTGAVCLGKTNMDEFAMGSSNEYSYFGPVKNPWHEAYVAGGSSGGSAAAVAAGLATFATGSDTGGSIRQPAAFCGISGIKPTYGLASRFGMVAYASSMDQAGPMACSAEDLAFILQAMLGFDARDSTSIATSLPNYQEVINNPLPKLRIGLPKGFFKDNVDNEIRSCVEQALAIFQQAGCTLIECDFSLQSMWVPCYYLIACAESSSNLSRFDGIRYGHSTKHAKDITDLITRSREEGFGLEVKRRILTGTYVLSSGYYEAYYVQAQKVRRMIKDELLTTLNSVDVLIGPTTPTCAFKLDDPPHDPTVRYLSDEFTVAANLAGLPALSIPCGLNTYGLPIGLQLMGPHFSEELLLQLAHFYQQNTNWHQHCAPNNTEAN